jgi:NitT/TauT family transport system ATP-binding protein
MTILAEGLGLLTDQMARRLTAGSPVHGQLIEIVALRKRFGDLPVLDGWDLQGAAGRALVLIGPSGCGKTTFLRLVAGLEPPTSGAIHSHADQVGFVFQDPRLIPWKTVDDNLRFVSPDRDPGPILGSLGLEGFADYLPGRLSGGMRQRVNLARALLTQPDLLILDEAFRSSISRSRPASSHPGCTLA